MIACQFIPVELKEIPRRRREPSRGVDDLREQIDMANITCSIEGCERPASVPGAARGWCRAHYSRWQTYGDALEPVRRIRTLQGVICEFEGCEKPARTRKMCPTHYARIRRTGSVHLVERPRKICSVESCDAPFYGNALCRFHYDFNRYAVAPRTGKSDPEKDRHRAKRRRAVKKGAAGSHTAEEWRLVLLSFEGRCAYCGDVADTKDHMVPLVRGGSDFIDNIVPACRSCNSSKQSKTLEEWRPGMTVARRLAGRILPKEIVRP